MGPEEEAEFAAYVTARREHVRRTAYLLCRDWHKADDLAQIAFVKVYGAWDRIRDRGALDAYVRSCLVRAVVDESRRPWRRETTTEYLPESGGTAAPVGFGRPGSHAGDVSESIADRGLMQQALTKVPLGQRTVLVLRFYSGMDVAAVASELGCSEGNVKSQTARGLRALKAALGPEGLAAFGTGPKLDDDETMGGDGFG
ncbi:SigE family RNA polymerase sigma factor [Nakamurella lactea]|uniref:SigE family RNA polymerase sigma factor n=1 Tax=Nakamurella lactea TaxID=459515 RepID=UPI0003F62E26|nr:SigE family RNA polymerase sigma factor [Nakamurella lactea]